MKRFAVIVPVYQSQATLAACLTSLAAQRFSDFDVVLVDSSPGEACLRIAEKFDFHLIRPGKRLWMHEARRLGIESSQSEFIVFSDPDCIAAPDWLERIDDAIGQGHDLIGGAIACWPEGYWQQVAHQIKFWLWQPGIAPRSFRQPPFDSLASANMAIRRTWYDRVGGLDARMISADTLICYQSAQSGVAPFFQSHAVVSHIHGPITLRALLRERWSRSQDFFRMRSRQWRRPHACRVLFLLGWPFLVLRMLGWRALHAVRTRTLNAFLAALPWIALCECAWMLGQTLAATRLPKPGRRA